MIEKVLAAALRLGGTEESQTLRALCRSAVEELRGRLREGLAPEDCGERFILAAAWTALAELETAGGDDVESFTAGEVTIRRGDGRARREALLIQAERVMKPYLRDEGFSFRGVRG